MPVEREVSHAGPDASGPARGALPSPSMTTEARLVELPGGALAYTLRRSPRSRRLRVTVHPQRGVVVSIPPADRRGWGRAEPIVDAFLAQRETWIRRHLSRQADERAVLDRRGPIDDGGVVRYLGDLHRVRIAPAGPVGRWSLVERRLDHGAPELVLHLAPIDARTPAEVLAAWCRSQAAIAIGLAIDAHADVLAVRPRRVSLRDPRSRWGSASRTGTLSFSWRLVLAPPEALETVVVHELAHLRIFGHGPRFWSLVETRAPDHRTWRRWLRDHSTELHAAFATAPDL